MEGLRFQGTYQHLANMGQEEISVASSFFNVF